LPPGLASLAPDVLVVAGQGAPTAEQLAARQVADAFRAAGGPADNLVDDEAALAQLDRTTASHLVLVGTCADNELLRQQWGHLAVDRTTRGAERNPATGQALPPFYPGAPETGFHVFGFGTFAQPDTGYLEPGRNDLALLPEAIDAPRRPGYRLRLNVTGVGAAGVARAAARLLASGCVGGVVPGAGETLPATGDALRLEAARLASELPLWVPRAGLLGWLQPDATEYAGFLQAAGRPARLAWRAKYLPPGGLQSFADGPQRRSSHHELWLAAMGTPEAAAQAIEGLKLTLGAKPRAWQFEPVTLGGRPAWQSHDFHLMAVGSWLLMASLPEPAGAELLGLAAEGAARHG
jgi:hypothetical protein